MTQSASKYIAALSVLAMALHIAPVLSARAPNLVSGSVTSVQARSIVVNGITYNVQIQGGALRQLAQLHVGDRVQLLLIGPKGAAQVSAIRVQHEH